MSEEEEWGPIVTDSIGVLHRLLGHERTRGLGTRALCTCGWKTDWIDSFLDTPPGVVTMEDREMKAHIEAQKP